MRVYNCISLDSYLRVIGGEGNELLLPHFVFPHTRFKVRIGRSNPPSLVDYKHEFVCVSCHRLERGLWACKVKVYRRHVYN